MDLLTEPALSSGEVGDLQDSDVELVLINQTTPPEPLEMKPSS
jgi:hypothetical protein